MSTQTHVHHGHHDTIPPTASPGLLFLKAYTAAIDSISAQPGPLLSGFLTAESRFVYNGQPAISAARLLVVLQMRNAKLSKYAHHVNKAWEILDGASKGVTVMYESTVELAFRGARETIWVPQFTILELRHCEVGDGLRLVESRVYTDRSGARGG
jgi:hypothetical protein